MRSLSTLLLLPCALPGCGSSRPEPPHSPPVVRFVTVSARDAAVTYDFVAQTQSSRQVDIHARIGGFLEQRVYTEGAMVKQGEILFRIDRKPFVVQLDQAQAGLAGSESVLFNARANLERVRPLVARNALSKKDLDDAIGQEKSAAAAAAQSRAQVEQARLNLSYATIVSPVSGISGSAMQADGTYISDQNSLLTTVAALSPMWVNFSMSENQFQALREEVRKGQLRVPQQQEYVVEVELADGTLFPHTGRVTFLDPYYNSKTGSFLVRVSVANPEGLLRPNQFVRVHVKGAIRPHAILVPQRAVQQGSKGAFVWVLDGEHKVSERPVTVGEWNGDDWFINQGLVSGERVVIDGTQMLAPDMHVGIATADAPLNSAGS